MQISENENVIILEGNAPQIDTAFNLSMSE
jgi:hypothetical protein